jgi:hypothetical protein
VESYSRVSPFRRPIAVDDDQTGDERSYSVKCLVTPGGIALSSSEKDDAFADSLETHFQPLTDPSARQLLRSLMLCRGLTLCVHRTLVTQPGRG